MMGYNNYMLTNLPTFSTNITNQGAVDSSVSNLPSSFIAQGLWVELVLPWQLDLPWQYEIIFTNTVNLVNKI
jgi:hypothetical protein